MDSTIAALRAFNRFYTRFVGALDRHYLGTELTFAEARMLYEIATRDAPLAADLQDAIGLDAGYASRIVKRFEVSGWVERGRSADARRRPIALTTDGRAMFADLDRRQRDVLAERIAEIPASDGAVLSSALDTARAILGGAAAGYAIRTFRPGDLGLLAARQAILYQRDNDWGAPMEALLLDVTSAFVRDFKPGREQCWVAERGGDMAGAILCCDSGDGRARLRLLHVEPSARGLGIGGALVGACVEFARAAGYRGIWLWTHSTLLSARRLYATAGFQITSSEIHHHFGRPELGETWELVF